MCAVKKKTEEPSVLGMCFYGMLTALFGAVLGALYMASFPATPLNNARDLAKFEEAQEDAYSSPKDIYYMQGPNSTVKTWIDKRQAWVDGNLDAVEFTHREVNAWLSAKFKPATAPSGEGAPKMLIVPGVPNIHITKYLITLSLPTSFIINGKTYSRTVIVTGVFDDSGDSVEFSMKSVRIDSASVPLVDIIGHRIVDTLLKAYTGSDEFLAIESAWSSVTSVELSDGIIRLQLQ